MTKIHNHDDIILNRYQVIDLIGEGGQAYIMKALDQQTGQNVAIKQMIASPNDRNYQEEQARFTRAANLRIQHKNVVDPIDFGTEEGEYYLIMPFIEGGINLQQWLLKYRSNPDFAVLEAILRQIVEGLIAIHARNIVHRDLKPENILIDLNLLVHMIDFGIARILTDKTITQKPTLLGSIYWMPPEQIDKPGQEDARSDLYALGAILYFMLTEQSPVQGKDSNSLIVSICSTIPPSPRQVKPAVPVHLDAICMKLLAKLPQHRFQSAGEVLAALDHHTAEMTVFQPTCLSCGVQRQADYQFCPSCGAALTQTRNVAKCIACGSPVDQANQCNRCGRPFGQVPHRLTFTSGSLTGELFRIPEGIYTIGREELGPRDCRISRKHLGMACCNGSVYIQDLGSANKTYVGSQMADLPILLQNNRQILIAGNTATYLQS
jgi:serine/threonine protein kinase